MDFQSGQNDEFRLELRSNERCEVFSPCLMWIFKFSISSSWTEDIFLRSTRFRLVVSWKKNLSNSSRIAAWISRFSSPLARYKHMRLISLLNLRLCWQSAHLCELRLESRCSLLVLLFTHHGRSDEIIHDKVWLEFNKESEWEKVVRTSRWVNMRPHK